MNKNLKTGATIVVVALAGYGLYTLLKMRRPQTSSFSGSRIPPRIYFAGTYTCQSGDVIEITKNQFTDPCAKYGGIRQMDVISPIGN
jgi:hypothetical protein